MTGRMEEEESRGLLRAGGAWASERAREEEEDMGCREDNCCDPGRRSGSQLRSGKRWLGGAMMARLMREGGGREGAGAVL